MNFTPQSESDGKIEFIAFKSELNLALNKQLGSRLRIISKKRKIFELLKTQRRVCSLLRMRQASEDQRNAHKF
jgi:hypothetical protein